MGLIANSKSFFLSYMTMDEPLKPQILDKFFPKTHKIRKGYILMQFDRLFCLTVSDSSFSE